MRSTQTCDSLDRRGLWSALLGGLDAGLHKTAGKPLYHGSSQRFQVLKAGQYVTPYREDAAVFAVPWDSRELVDAGRAGGRPPRQLRFREQPPPDHPIYIYEVIADTKLAPTNTGAQYAWNRTTTQEAPARLVETIPSWHQRFLVRSW
jgi:hypothetical protein